MKGSPFFRFLQVTGSMVSLFRPGKARVKLSNTKTKFKDFPGLKTKFKDFPGQQKNPGLFQDVATLYLSSTLEILTEISLYTSSLNTRHIELTKKSNFCYTRTITLKRITSGGTHL